MNVYGKKVTVIGLGRTACAVARLLLREGARPYVTDAAVASQLAPYIEDLEKLGVPYECGGHTELLSENVDFVIPSPGVPLNAEPVQQALQAGAALLPELDFASSCCDIPIIAVTGTNGKTTTTELLCAMLNACGKSTLLAGNNALPFSAAVMEVSRPHYIVLEVSSYQLEGAQLFHPKVATVLNITKDHFERHGTMENYASAKRNIFSMQQYGDHAVMSYDDSDVGAFTTYILEKDVRIHYFSTSVPLNDGLWCSGELILHGRTELISVADLPMPGKHNLENALAAFALVEACALSLDVAAGALRVFHGVEHRIEYVAEFEGVEYYNDSKSTNLESLRVALESIEAPIILIAGGQGKGSDYATIGSLVADKVSTLIAIGEDGPAIEAAFANSGVSIRAASSMEEAVALATDCAKPGMAVLLSPGCSSFDMFDDFEHRGRVFKHSVQRLGGQGDTPQ